jgi:calcineurin-like phosphoesterase family protein
MAIWFTSDQHFGHAKIIEYCRRPFATVEEMDAELIRRWNVVVHPDDLVIVVGDFSFRHEDETAAILAHLHGEKLLVLGNHDDRKTKTYWRRVGFRDVVDRYCVILEGLGPVLVKHEPVYRVESAIPQINGHVHEKWKTKSYRTTGHRYLNVGVDQWAFAPVSIDEVRMTLLQEKGNHEQENRSSQR